MSISLFRPRRLSRLMLPHAIASLMGSGCPIIGYFGAFARWFDYETVRRVAVFESEYSWLLIGWDYDGSIRASDFEEVENIHVIGPISYELLPAYAKHFSVSTIPFLINDITLSTSPIKLFEYMALGHPIVTTSLPGMQAQVPVTPSSRNQARTLRIKIDKEPHTFGMMRHLIILP